MRTRLGFTQAKDGHLLVLIEKAQVSLYPSELFEVTKFSDENLFLYYVVLAELDDETTTSLIARALAVMSGQTQSMEWTEVKCSERQFRTMGLTLTKGAQSIDGEAAGFPRGADLREVLMQTPTPITMLEGPNHVITFMNPPYVQLLGRTSSDQVLGLPVRQALPESGFDECLKVLQRAYETGTPQMRKELKNSFQQADTGLTVEAYFDIVYHPVRNAYGSVVGIMAQATDVTERVLSRHVSESREQKLYTLWAELESIYASAPVGIALIDAKEFKVLRLNVHQAFFWGDAPDVLMNRPVKDIAGVPAELLQLIKRAAAGECLLDIVLEPVRGDVTEPWCVSVIPTLDASGHVATLTVITLDARGRCEPPPERQPAIAGMRRQ